MRKLGKYFDNFFDAINNEAPTMLGVAAAKVIQGFYVYADAMASANPMAYHHVYEWGAVGDPNARLFEVTVMPYPGGITLACNLLPSTMPNEDGYVFSQKASVMESGDIVSFVTEKNVPLYDGEFFRTGRFTFKPGGELTTQAFENLYFEYFATIGVKEFARLNKLSKINLSDGAGDAKRLVFER